MIINYNTRERIKDLHLHDVEFNGIVYDYDSRTITLIYAEESSKNMYNIYFNNVILCDIQSCSFWNGGNRIMGITEEKETERMKELYNIQNSNQDLYDNSYLTKNIEYLSICIQINSGDEILIVSESITVNESVVLK